jgi:MraZ protein
LLRFIGTHLQTVDPKGRIVLPSRFKRLLTAADHDTMVLTTGRERCLLLYPLGEWARLAEALDRLAPGEAKRDAIRTISDNTTEIELDANGRLTVPREFLDKVGIEREVALVGQLRYIEVWARAAYEQGSEHRAQTSSDILNEIL